jgi:hypothetical protein
MIGRLPRIAGAYLAACIAAGFTLGLSALVLPFIGAALEGRGQVDLPPLASLLYAWLLLGAWIGAFVAVLAFVPAAVVVAVAEAARLRSAAFYVAIGAIAAIACWAVVIREGGLLPMPGLALSLAPERALVTGALVLAAGLGGLAGGLVYWRIAGRTAGDWRGRPRSPSQKPSLVSGQPPADVAAAGSHGPSAPQT